MTKSKIDKIEYGDKIIDDSVTDIFGLFYDNKFRIIVQSLSALILLIIFIKDILYDLNFILVFLPLIFLIPLIIVSNSGPTFRVYEKGIILIQNRIEENKDKEVVRFHDYDSFNEIEFKKDKKKSKYMSSYEDYRHYCVVVKNQGIEIDQELTTLSSKDLEVVRQTMGKHLTSKNIKIS